MDWGSLPLIPDSAKAGAFAHVISGVSEYQMPIDGGWVNLADAAHTSGSPETILAGVKAQFAVDGLGATTERRFERRLSPDVWVDSTFAPRGVGDAYSVRLTCQVATVSSASGRYIDFTLGIGSGWATTVAQTRLQLIKGSGIGDFLTVSLPIFCLETFGRHGGRFYVTPSHDITIWAKAIMIQRTFAP